MSDPSVAELAAKLAVREERMKTMQAEHKTDIARQAEDIAKRDADAAKRDRDNTRWMAGLWVGAVVVIIAVLGFLIRTGT